MAITYRTNNTASGAASTIVITKPSGTVDGDLLIAVFGSLDNSVQTLSGWTSIVVGNSGGGGTTSSTQSFYKIASSEGSDYTWTVNSSVMCAGCILRVDGQQASPIGSSEGFGNTSGGTSLSGGSGITPANGDNFFIQAWSAYFLGTGGIGDMTAQAIATSNPSWTEICDLGPNSGGNAVELSVVYGQRSQTTGTGANSATLSLSPHKHSGVFLEFKRITAFTSTITDTATVTDAITPSIGYTAIITDTVTATDSTTADKARGYSNTAKSSNAWANTQKS